MIREGLLKVAVYRDAQRQLHACSAICPHLGGIVRWNHGERSFDCPVHGSRFDRRGQVLNGPSNEDLTPVELVRDKTGDSTGKAPDGADGRH